MEKYIVTFEDGQHYVATEISEEDKESLADGVLTIIRCSDAKELNPDGETWEDLNKWEY